VRPSAFDQKLERVGADGLFEKPKTALVVHNRQRHFEAAESRQDDGRRTGSQFAEAAGNSKPSMRGIFKSVTITEGVKPLHHFERFDTVDRADGLVATCARDRRQVITLLLVILYDENPHPFSRWSRSRGCAETNGPPMPYLRVWHGGADLGDNWRPQPFTWVTSCNWGGQAPFSTSGTDDRCSGDGMRKKTTACPVSALHAGGRAALALCRRTRVDTQVRP